MIQPLLLVILQNIQSRTCGGLGVESRLAWSSFLSPEPQGDGQTQLRHKGNWTQSTATAHLWEGGREQINNKIQKFPISTSSER